MLGVYLKRSLIGVIAIACAAAAQPSGNCLLLNQNPIGQYVMVQDDPSLALTNAFTIAGWAYPVNLGEWSGFICKAGSEDEFGDRNCAGFNMQLSGIYSTGQSGQLLFFFGINRDPTALPKWCATAQLTSGRWAHIAAVYDGSTIKVYRDGNLETTCNGYSGNLVANTCPLFFGVDIPGNPEYWTGAMDDIAIWTRALSAADITAAKSGNFTGLTDGMVGLWRFEEGVGTTVGDTGPLAKNHGVIRGSPIWRGINPSNINTLVAPTSSAVTPRSVTANRDLSWTRRGSDYVFNGAAIKAVRILTLSGVCVYARRALFAGEVRVPSRALGSGVLVSEIVFASGETASVPMVR